MDDTSRRPVPNEGRSPELAPAIVAADPAAGLPEPEIDLERSDLQRVSEALGSTPETAYAAAHAYPAAAPAFTKSPMAVRPDCQPEPLRLYVHIPFCNYSCSFCFFAIRVTKELEPMQRYVDALKKELEWIPRGTELSQLFMGGGTPTALPPALLDEVLTCVFDRTTRTSEKVHTVEASPDSLTRAHVQVLNAHRIGRVSMGIQSFDEDVLEKIERRHSAGDALKSCELLVNSGFIVNTDLIYGLPGQSKVSFRRDFEELARRGVQSVTVYDLHLNEKTRVARTLAEEEKMRLAHLANWRQFVKQVAENCGFTQTRWHTFKRMDTIAARHERAAHHRTDGRGFQFGAGMSARSHLGRTVYSNHPNIHVYMERVNAGQSPVEKLFDLSVEDRKTQFVARSIGDGKTLSRSAYGEAFGRPIEGDFGPTLKRLIAADLITDDGEHLNLTEMGRLVHDKVTYNFYPARALEWLAQRKHAAMAQ